MSGAVGSPSGAVSDAVARVEAELGAFWSAPGQVGGEAAVKVRASTLNYVVICAPPDADAYREATERLSETHGGRTLLLTMSGRIAAWDLVPEVHAVCRFDGAVPVCYDRVDLTFGAVAASRSASVVRALALPELTTVVEIGAGAPQPLVDAVAGKFDRLIVDSGKTAPSVIARILQQAPCPVADRGMIRTYSWRELTARLFDDVPSALNDVHRVEIARTPPRPQGPGHIEGGAQDPAPVFLGWLASRLGWVFNKHPGPQRPAVGSARDRRGRSIEIALVETDRTDIGPGQLTAVRLRCSLGGEPLDCTLERTTQAAAVRWKMRGARNTDREHALGHKDETWVAIKAIDAREGDAVNRAALLAAAEWESTN